MRGSCRYGAPRVQPKSFERIHGRPRSFPISTTIRGVAGDRDRRARIHVRRRAAAVRPSAHLPRHGRRQGNHLLLLLDALPPRSRARSARRAAAGLRADRTRPDRSGAQAVAPSRNIIIAGAGIGGLTAALALAQRGFRVVVLEQAERLEETGAGIQLSPNATRVLIALGLEQRLRRRRGRARGGRDPRPRRGQILARIPLGDVCRSALRRALLGHPSRRPAGGAARSGARQPRHRAEARHRASRTSSCTATASRVACRHGAEPRGRARHRADRRRRAVVAAAAAARPSRQAGVPPPHRLARADPGRDASRPNSAAEVVQLWLGQDAHLVHYPVKRGALINIVAIVDDDRWRERRAGASPARARKCIARFSPLALGAAGARAARAAGALAQVGALRPAAAAAMGRRPRHAAGGRRPPDAAVPRPGRRDGDRGCRRAGGIDGAHIPTTFPARCGATSARGSGRTAPGAERRPAQRPGLPHRAAPRRVLRNLYLADGRRKVAASPLRLAL